LLPGASSPGLPLQGLFESGEGRLGVPQRRGQPSQCYLDRGAIDVPVLLETRIIFGVARAGHSRGMICNIAT